MGKNKEKAVFVGQEEHLRMESILYAFAMKFLNKEELETVKGVISMTELGRTGTGRRIGAYSLSNSI